MKFLASIYTISEGRGLGFQPRTVVGADREMGGAYRFPYRGKLVPTSFPGIDGWRERFPEPWEVSVLRRCMQLDCRSVISVR